MSDAETLLETKELDSRQNDGLTVTLWWVKNTMDTFVTVLDTKTQPPVEHHIDVPKGVLPHAVYYHPMAYLPEDPKAA
ncbi:MAG TPA: hypothetical protein VD907_06925 [Verrucomicrobiae bacterium]|nr:hypothetical protein [Verrucomicrobiae bacterium]